MLYKFAAALGFTAFFMSKAFIAFITFSSQNTTQFAFAHAIKTVNPLLCATMGLDFFFPALFLIVSLAAGCVAAEITFNVFDMVADFLQKKYPRLSIKKASEA